MGRFVLFLAAEELKHRSIKTYRIRHLHIAEGKRDPFAKPLQCLEYILKGIKRREAEDGGDKTGEAANLSRDAAKNEGCVVCKQNPDKAMLWAACCLGYFCFFRVGEMTVPTDDEFDPVTHLMKKDLAVDNQVKPRTLRVHLKQSKKDPFKPGISLFVGRTGQDRAGSLPSVCRPGIPGGKRQQEGATIYPPGWVLPDLTMASD